MVIIHVIQPNLKYRVSEMPPKCLVIRFESARASSWPLDARPTGLIRLEGGLTGGIGVVVAAAEDAIGDVVRNWNCCFVEQLVLVVLGVVFVVVVVERVAGAAGEDVAPIGGEWRSTQLDWLTLNWLIREK